MTERRAASGELQWRLDKMTLDNSQHHVEGGDTQIPF